MGTNNRRVAAYLPLEVDKAFLEYKIQRGLATEKTPNQKDSQALIQMMSEFLGVSHLVNQEAAHANNFVTLERFEELVSQVMELSSRLDQALAGFKAVESEPPRDLLSDSQVARFQNQSKEPSPADNAVLICGAVLAKRLSVGHSTISERKKSSPEDFAKWTCEKDPDNIAWSFVPDSNLFQPIGDVPKELLSELVSEPLEGLSVAELAKRLNVAPSTLSHWKSSDPKRGKPPDELLRTTRDKDPDGIGWILIPGTSRFKPEKPLLDDSPIVQCELLSATPSDQVNPVAAQRSERSGEG